MKNTLLVKSLIGIALCLLTQCQHQKPHTMNDTEITLKINETTVIQLPSLSTAGYVWEPIMGKNGVIALEKMPNLPKAEEGPIRVGSSPDELFRIKGLSGGKVTLTFSQKRSWEKDIPAAKTKQFHITVL